MKTKAEACEVFRCQVKQTLGSATSLTAEVYTRSKGTVTDLAVGIF